MNKVLLFLLFLIGCNSANDRSCDLCGKWSFDRFEYAGYVTTDCKGVTNRVYKNISIKTDVHNITFGEYDLDEEAQELFIKIDTNSTEKFYMTNQDSIYILSDGCRFYFKRK